MGLTDCFPLCVFFRFSYQKFLMANLKSSKKDVRRISRRTARNTATRSKLKTLRKQVVGENPSPEAKAAYASALDKASKNNIVHPNKVAREKAKLAKNALHAKVRQ